MSLGFETRCRLLLEELALIQAGEPIDARPLTGGVASDIGVVQAGERQLCVKFALAQLKVQESWQAPIERNLTEYAWLQFAARCVPDNVPYLLGCSAGQYGFVMEYLAGEGVYLWKQALLDEAPDRGEAPAVADVLGRIHGASSAAGFDRAPFGKRDDFHALRIEPYLIHTASRHPALAGRLHALAKGLYEADKALIHGDVSPKNILFRNARPVLLDAECATLGDPAFDVAFCLNHLVLKSIHLPASHARLLASVGAFWNAYAKHVSWEDREELEARVAGLLPALMLARIDGKSPVDYLSTARREVVRDLSVQLIQSNASTLAGLLAGVEAVLENPVHSPATGQNP